MYCMTLVLPDVIISLRSWDSSTGCLWNRELISNWWCLFTSHCMVLLRRTCRTTVNSSRTWDVDILRSSDVYACVVPRTQPQIGDRSFSVAGPQLWNNLPTEIRRRWDTTFKHLWTITWGVFVRLGCGALWLLLNCARYELKHSYSLTHSLIILVGQSVVIQQWTNAP